MELGFYKRTKEGGTDSYKASSGGAQEDNVPPPPPPPPPPHDTYMYVACKQNTHHTHTHTHTHCLVPLPRREGQSPTVRCLDSQTSPAQAVPGQQTAAGSQKVWPPHRVPPHWRRTSSWTSPGLLQVGGLPCFSLGRRLTSPKPPSCPTHTSSLSVSRIEACLDQGVRMKAWWRKRKRKKEKEEEERRSKPWRGWGRGSWWLVPSWLVRDS